MQSAPRKGSLAWFLLVRKGNRIPLPDATCCAYGSNQSKEPPHEALFWFSTRSRGPFLSGGFRPCRNLHPDSRHQDRRVPFQSGRRRRARCPPFSKRIAGSGRPTPFLHLQNSGGTAYHHCTQELSRRAGSGTPPSAYILIPCSCSTSIPAALVHAGQFRFHLLLCLKFIWLSAPTALFQRAKELIELPSPRACRIGTSASANHGPTHIPCPCVLKADGVPSTMCPRRVRAAMLPRLAGRLAAIVPPEAAPVPSAKMKVPLPYSPERSKARRPTMKRWGADIGRKCRGRYIAAPEGVPAEKRWGRCSKTPFKTILQLE